MAGLTVATGAARLGACHPGRGSASLPTLAGINKKVAAGYLSLKIFSSTVQKGLKLFFQLKRSGL
ncbi:MAG: hypothetical protein HY885_06410 [Deltaproteobacteria bacterium]|nr:hypothetical protein [Deltaproteobacteria bacterium]